jgi:hypothetical protein
MVMQHRIKCPLEIKSLGDREFEGYGAVFRNVDLGGDVILPGAFKASLDAQERLPPMFWMHQPDQVPGKWLAMREDRHGLLVKGVLADTELGRETHTLLKMEAVTGLSIGYYVKDQEFTDDGSRILKEVELVETSIVSMPMNPLAQVSAVKTRTSLRGEYVPTSRELEHDFRSLGCSKSVSKRLVSLIRSEEYDDDAAGAMPGSSVVVTADQWEADAEVQRAAEMLKQRIEVANLRLPTFLKGK